jgi:hypothetical protein
MRTLSLIFLCFTLSAATVYCQTDRDSLRGLKGVSVRVELLDKSEDGGLEVITLQSEIELQLRKAAIKIVNDSRPGETPGTGRLTIRVTSLRTSDTRFASQIEGVFYEPATVDRTREHIVASVWNISRMITAGDNLRQRVSNTASGIVTIFANDYLSVNQR